MGNMVPIPWKLAPSLLVLATCKVHRPSNSIHSANHADLD